MSLNGKVISVTENHAVVEVTPRPECQGCHACTGLLDGEKRSSTRQIKVLKNNFDVQENDQVAVDLNPGHGSIAAILIFGIPILAFLAGLTGAPFICDYFSLPVSDIYRLFSGFILMAGAFLCLAFFSRSSLAEKLSMRITEKKKSPDKIPGTK